jgi:predicted Zn finger-like uncharacterized protein
MNVVCPQCASVFRVDPAKVPAGGVRARCSICGGVIPVPEPRSAIATPAGGIPLTATPPGGAPPARMPVPTPFATPIPPVSTPASETPAPVAHAPAVTAEVPAAAGSPAAVSGTHFNPYLSRDPHQRARRLARALASDIVAYYPDKHSEALRDGTFKELFSEEIKKSYEDYVTQLGAELAESTTYFQDALNEVLARGKRVF